MEVDVFISYSRKDSLIADRICAAFDREGITYFIDRQGIGGGMEFPDMLAEAIMKCKIVLFLASENAYASKFTKREITFAFNEKSENSLYPYFIDNSTLPAGMRLIFSSTNWRNIVDHPIDTILVDDLKRLLGKCSVSSTNKLESRNPQPTMRPKAESKITVGRNDPCPCGSGLKYKNCHGKYI